MLVDVANLQLHPSRRGRRPPRPSAALLELTHRHGPLQPVLVRAIGERRFEILGNVETWLAAQSCGHHRIPVEVLGDIDDDAAREILDGHRSGDPITEARRYRRLVEIERERHPRGALSRVAEQCGVGHTRVAHALRLLTLPALVQEALRIGALTAGHGRAILLCRDTERRLDLAARAITGRLSVRATERAARAGGAGEGEVSAPDTRTGAGGSPSTRSRSPDIVRLEGLVTRRIGSPTTIDETAGTLTIDYRGSLEVLEGLLERLGVEVD